MNDIAEATVARASSPRPGAGPAGGSAGSSPRTDAAHHDGRSRTDTRARIQQIAVELFSEHGYEGTSLREIAERLGVTKAALYYHFKSKEDIILSLVEDYQAQMDALIGWAREHPGNAETRREILARYMQIVAERSQVFRMLHQNQAALNTMAAGSAHAEERAASACRPACRTRRVAPRPGAGHDGARLDERRLDVPRDQVPDRDELSEIVSSIAAEIVGPAARPTAASARRGDADQRGRPVANRGRQRDHGRGTQHAGHLDDRVDHPLQVGVGPRDHPAEHVAWPGDGVRLQDLADPAPAAPRPRRARPTA